MTSANTGAMLYQLSCEATHWDRGQFIEFISPVTRKEYMYMNYFIYALHHFTPHGRDELNKLTSLPMCGFIAQLVEHRTGIRGGHGLNPVEASIFSGFFFPIA